MKKVIFIILLGAALLLSSCSQIAKEIRKSGYTEEFLFVFGIIAIGTIYWLWIKPWVEERPSKETKVPKIHIEKKNQSVDKKRVSLVKGIVDWERIEKLTDSSEGNPENLLQSALNPSLTEMEISLQIMYEKNLDTLAGGLHLSLKLRQIAKKRDLVESGLKQPEDDGLYELDGNEIKQVAKKAAAKIFRELGNDDMHTFLPLIFSPDLRTDNSIFTSEPELRKIIADLFWQEVETRNINENLNGTNEEITLAMMKEEYTNIVRWPSVMPIMKNKEKLEELLKN
jgi:hypothetical protein